MVSFKKIAVNLLIGLAALILVSGCGEDDNPSGLDNNPPYTPYSPSPTDGSNNRSVESDLFWRCYDQDGDQLTYNVYFDSTENIQLVIEDHPDTMYGLGTLAGQTTYYWRIVAYDSQGDSAAGPLWRFSTGDEANYPPTEPSGPSPENGATDVQINTLLSWQCSDPNAGDFLSYNIYFDTSSVPSLVALQHSSASYNPGLLEPGLQYFWKVVAYDNQGDSTSGPLWSFTTGEPAEGIFAALAIARMLIPMGDSLFAMDEIVARFDSSYAPCDPVRPLQAETVTCNDYVLVWDPQTQQHIYFDYTNFSFIELGGLYVFDVIGTPSVPSLIDSIQFPSAETYITSPGQGDTVSIDGFDVSWSSTGEGTVLFMILSGDDTTNVSVQTDNDGTYTFTTTDLEPLGGQAGEYSIMIIHQHETAITAEDYDPRSYIWARVINLVQVYIE